VAWRVSPEKRFAVPKSESTALSLEMNGKSPSRTNANGTRMEYMFHSENIVS
jgi:hypothetical protein